MSKFETTPAIQLSGKHLTQEEMWQLAKVPLKRRAKFLKKAFSQMAEMLDAHRPIVTKDGMIIGERPDNQARKWAADWMKDICHVDVKPDVQPASVPPITIVIPQFYQPKPGSQVIDGAAREVVPQIQVEHRAGVGVGISHVAEDSD